MYTPKLDAEPFIKSEGFYSEEFKTILILLIYCYKKILEKEPIRTYKKRFQLENYLRNVLVKDYLRIYKEKFGLSYLGFEVEPGEINLKHATIGFIDIKVTNCGLVNSLKCDENIYYAIECKRVDNSSKKINEYIDEGILRFVEGKYSSEMPLASMIGFIEKDDPKIVKTHINNNLNQTKNIDTQLELTNYILEDFNDLYFSIHKRVRNPTSIYIFHLLFDYTTLIKIES